MPTPHLPPGTVLDVAEPDYMYGTGRLRLRVSEVLRVERLPDGPWWVVRGMGLCWNGADDGERVVWVRATAIAAAVRTSGPGVTLAVVKVFRSVDRLWRVERADVIRVYSRKSVRGGWTLRATLKTPAELDAWLKEQGDPVSEWVED